MDWFPWYFTLYEQDTMHLSPYQDGCYRRLIDHYMKTRAPLPDNDAALARIIGDSLENWLALAADQVRPFFKPNNGKLCHKRCDKELSSQDKRTKTFSESGKKGAEIRKRNALKENDNLSHLNSPPNRVVEASAIAQDRTGQDIDNKYNPVTVSPRSNEPDHPLGEVDPKNSRNYEFNGKVIRLSTSDFNAWLKMTGWMREGLWQELDDRDEWYAGQSSKVQKNWFIATANYLRKASDTS